MLRLILNQIPTRQHKQRNNHRRKLNRRIEIRTQTPHRPKEQCDSQIPRNNNEVKRKESSSIQYKSTHEVDDNGEDQDLDSREGEVDGDLRHPERGGAVEGIGAVFVEHGAADHGGG